MIRVFLFGMSRLVHLVTGIEGVCRLEPSCSTYCSQAIQNRGWVTGLSLCVRRLLSCRPGGKFGLDPVPEGRNR